MAASALAATLWFWHQAIPFVIAGEFQTYLRFLGPIAGLLIAGMLFAFGGMFVHGRKLFSALIAAAIAIPFLALEPELIVVVVLIASILFLVWAAHRIRKEFILSTGFSVTKIAKAGLPSYFTIMSLIIATFYLSTARSDEEKAISDLFPKSAFNFIVQRASGPLAQALGIPSLDPEMKVNEIIRTLLGQELASQGVDISQIPPRELTRLEKEQREALIRQYGFQLTGDEKFSDIFYNQIVNRMKDLLGPYSIYLPLVSAVAFFLAFKTLSLPFYYVTLAFLFLLIRLLASVKILKSEKIQLEVEKLTL